MALADEGKRPLVVDRYELCDEIGSGGMATVHLGRLRGSAGFARAVAVKRLHPTFSKDPELAAMLVDEARVTTRIRHPNVVPTLDVVANGDELFLVMEFVLGDSLAALGRATDDAGARLDPRIAAAILVDVLHGLHAAHEAVGEDGAPLGIVHRDVSPQNILVGVDGLARVLDFGVAKAVGRYQTTRDGKVKGKLAYMAPEQIALDAVDRRADVFAASIVLWEALVGRPLFAHEGPARTLDAVLHDPIALPSAVAGTPAALDDVVLHGLERDRERRYPTAASMAEALAAAIGVASRREVGEALEARLGARIAARRALLRAVETSTGAPLVIGTPRRARPAFDDAEATARDAVESSTATESGAAVEVADRGRPAAGQSRVSFAPPLERRPRLIAWAALAVAVLVAGLVGRAALRAEPPAPAAVTSAPTATAAAPAPAPSSAAAAPSAVESASAAATASAPRPRASPPARPSQACRDPFRRDERGILIPRPECFR